MAWLGDLEQIVASESAGRSGAGMAHTGICFQQVVTQINVLRCQLYKCLVSTDRHSTREDERMIDPFLHSGTPLPSGSTEWTSTRLWLHLRRSGTRVRDWSFASELKVWVWDVWLRLFLSWPILANSVWSVSVFTSWQEVKLISILWHCFRERMF